MAYCIAARTSRCVPGLETGLMPMPTTSGVLAEADFFEFLREFAFRNSIVFSAASLPASKSMPA